MVGGCGGVNDRVGEIVAVVAGGKHEKRRRIANFAPQLAAGSTGSATVLAKCRQECGTCPLLRDSRHYSSLHGENC